MATPPLPVAIINRIKARNQSVRWTAILREVREFRAYCCNIDSDNIMNVSKEPVVILTLTPNPICLGSAMAWDFTGSYAPGSTTYTVTATVTEGTGVTQTVTEEVNVIDCSDSLLLDNIYASTDGSGVYYWE
jgi:hypothetical protein